MEGDLAFRLSELWSAERCDWALAFEPAMYGRCEESCWKLTLSWTQEYDNPHGADWATFDWCWYSLVSEGGPVDLLTDAVAWCEELAQLAPDEESAA